MMGVVIQPIISVVSCFPGLSVLLCLTLWYSMMIVAIAHTTSRHTTSTTTILLLLGLLLL